MFRLVLVDDEESALEGLANYVDWQSLGFQVAGRAKTIGQAMDLIESGPVDALLTDIHLDGESGLDLIRQVKAKYPGIRCVILSGYGEFEYAQQALRYGVVDFLTKPVRFETLRQTFQLLGRQLLEARQHRSEQEEYLGLRRSAFFNDLARGATMGLDAQAARELAIRTKGDMRLLRFRLYQASGSEEEHKRWLRRALLETLAEEWGEFHLFNNVPREYAVLLYHLPKEKLHALVQKVAGGAPGLELGVGVSRVFTGLEGFYTGYIEAGKALDYQLLHQGGPVVFYTSVQEVLPSERVLGEELARQVNDCLANKDAPMLQELVLSGMEQLGRGATLNNLYAFCFELQLLIDNFLHSYLPGYRGMPADDSMRTILAQKSPEELTHYVQGYLASAQPYIERANPCFGNIIHEIQRYIHQHYSENITLHKLAEQFYLHPTYLSRLFKEKTGSNFVDYLTMERVEQAKRLLRESQLKVYSVGKAVGYQTPKYFSRIFREATGMSPKEYRDSAFDRRAKPRPAPEE